MHGRIHSSGWELHQDWGGNLSQCSGIGHTVDEDRSALSEEAQRDVVAEWKCASAGRAAVRMGVFYILAAKKGFV